MQNNTSTVIQGIDKIYKDTNGGFKPLNEDEKKFVDEAYDALLESKENAYLESEDTSDLDAGGSINIDVPEDYVMEGSGEAHVVKGVYDPNTGIVQPTGEDMSYNNSLRLIENNKDIEGISVEDLKSFMEKSDNALKDMSEYMALLGLMKRRMNGEKFNPYPLFPPSYQSMVNQQLILNHVPVDKNNRSFTANFILEGLINDFKASNNNGVIDLDNMMDELNSMFEDTTMKVATDASNYYLKSVNDRKDTIDHAIGEFRKSGDNKKVEDLINIRSYMDASYNLEDFSEYCKTAKVKKFDLEKPERVYQSFITKYENHKNNINNIADCPQILARHFPNRTMDDFKRLCITFCKYTLNWSPDNIGQHTFMYYFIRNIVMLDVLNPRGTSYESMTEENKKYYDKYHDALESCMYNLNEGRNKTN